MRIELDFVGKGRMNERSNLLLFCNWGFPSFVKIQPNGKNAEFQKITSSLIQGWSMNESNPSLETQTLILWILDSTISWDIFYATQVKQIVLIDDVVRFSGAEATQEDQFNECAFDSDFPNFLTLKQILLEATLEGLMFGTPGRCIGIKIDHWFSRRATGV